MNRMIGTLLVVMAMTAACAAPTRIPSDIPMADTPVVPPTAQTPPALAAFSGRWVGQWSDGRDFRSDIAVIVHRFHEGGTGAVLIFGCGVPSVRDPNCPGSWPLTASFETGRLVVPETGGGHRLVFTVRGGSLDAELQDARSGQRLVSGRLSKLP